MERIKSPPLEIHGIDNSLSKSLALIMNDPDAPGGKGFVHWIMWNMELVSVLPEDPERNCHNVSNRRAPGHEPFWKDRVLGTMPSAGTDTPL